MLKKALLASAIAASLPMSAMAVGPIDGKIYGKMNVTAVNASYDENTVGFEEEDSWNLNSNASRIGVKGKAELSEGFYAIYKAEFEIYVDDGDSGSSKDNDTFEQRNIYVGLSGNYGTVFAGKHDTVLKLSQAKVDLFGDLEGGDIKNWMSGETRSSNIINYTTPSMNGFSASLMTVLGEDSDDDNEQDGLLDSYSAGVTYKAGDLYLAVARDENVKSGSVEKDNLDITRLVASYSFGDLTLGAVVQTAEDGDNYETNITNVTDLSYDEDSYTLSAKYKTGDFTWKLQYGQGEYEVKDGGAVEDEAETEALVFGVDYKLAKKTKVYAYYSTIDTEYDFESGAASTLEEDEVVYGIGMEHKF
ncbi:porin [Candidatus Pelagadaptatus aseana]|uniref:porin n=1 Tax=Candidatus Pelagadaptatus aseana TaxID=3120508 RepID=UPI003C703188